MSEPVNVSPDTRFDEATPDQFREFWDALIAELDSLLARCYELQRYEPKEDDDE